MQQRRVYKINKIAKELGVSIQTIKNYEDRGILPKPKRDIIGWRYYTWEDLVKIKALYVEEIVKRPKRLKTKKKYGHSYY
jgi:predicted site-specific integrase-resolvase